MSALARPGSGRGEPPAAGAATPKGSRVWLWVLAAFALQFAAWTAWFIIAAHHRVEEVPLATPVRPAGN